MISFLTEPVQRLRLMGWIEGTTLISLLGIAVPLKYLAEQPGLVSVLGPIHGAAFIAYLTLASATVFGGGWTMREMIRVLVASIVPFATFLNEGLLKRKQGDLIDV